MKPPSIKDFSLTDKKVLVRLDLDASKFRLRVILPTLKYLLDAGARLVLLGHAGRPGGVIDKSLSLGFITHKLSDLLGQKVDFGENFSSLPDERIVLFENLRFWSGEEKNDGEFIKRLSSLGDFYINEAFGTSHRQHASIVGIPKLLPHAAGLRFIEEVENLEKVFENPRRPVVVLISGVKEDKLSYAEPFLSFAARILIGGRLPNEIKNLKFQIKNYRSKIKIARLTPNSLDIDEKSIQLFREEIVKAKTLVVSGPLGKFEEEDHRRGTEKVFGAVAANKDAFKIAGGGDTIAALEVLGLVERFDWLSVGGGAMLEFLAKRTLPGIEALLA